MQRSLFHGILVSQQPHSVPPLLLCAGNAWNVEWCPGQGWVWNSENRKMAELCIYTEI